MVSGRDLYGFFGVRQRYRDWIRKRIEDYGFEAENDFLTILLKNTGGRPGKEYHLSLDMARELAMVKRTDTGREARKCFIECEKRLIEKEGGGIGAFRPRSIDV